MVNEFKVGDSVMVGDTTDRKFEAKIIAIKGDEITVREEGTMRSDIYPTRFVHAK